MKDNRICVRVDAFEVAGPEFPACEVRVLIVDCGATPMPQPPTAAAHTYVKAPHCFFLNDLGKNPPMMNNTEYLLFAWVKYASDTDTWVPLAPHKFRAMAGDGTKTNCDLSGFPDCPSKKKPINP